MSKQTPTEQERRHKATLIATIRLADTVIRHSRDAQRRLEAADRLEVLIDDYQSRFGPIVGSIESLWAVK